MTKIKSKKNTPELPLIGDVDDWEADTVKELLQQAEGSEIVFYIDSSGGSVYGALAVLNLLKLRRIKATAVVIGECSSAALLIFGAARRRLVAPAATLLFHKMRWQSEKHIDSAEARQWSHHFDKLEADLDRLQARLFGEHADLVKKWTAEGRYLTGEEIAKTGVAELVEI